MVKLSEAERNETLCTRKISIVFVFLFHTEQDKNELSRKPSIVPSQCMSTCQRARG